MSTAPLFISIPTSHPVKSSFCAGVQFSRDPIHGFNDRIKKYEKIEGCEQSITIIIIVIIIIIVTLTKFSIVIGSPRAYLSRNRRAITWVSDLNFL